LIFKILELKYNKKKIESLDSQKMTEQSHVVWEENAKVQERIAQLEAENSELKQNLANEKETVKNLDHLSKISCARLDDYHRDISHYREQCERADIVIKKMEKDMKERDLRIEQIEENVYNRQMEGNKEINRLKEELRRLKM
jgi:chromosome segregation ATPase